MIKYNVLYSNSLEFDKKGKWLRECFFGKYKIAYISMVVIDDKKRFAINYYFPKTYYYDLFESLDDAKSQIEKDFFAFLNDCVLLLNLEK
jgi:hypothetical protein